MKKSTIIFATFLALAFSFSLSCKAYAGFSFGLPSAIKKQVEKLDRKVEEKKKEKSASHYPVILTPGVDLVIRSEVIAQTGGIIEAGSSGTPIDGVRVQFPSGALSTTNVTVSLGYNTGTLSPNEGDYAGVALILDAGTVTQFEQPVTITVPFSDTSKVPVPYYVDSNGKLHPMQIIKIDRDAKIFTFQTFHASWFTWIFGEPVYAPGPDDIVNTGFSPDDDGFQVVNNGSEYNRQGECFGMTSFSLWYFMDKKVSKGKFYPRYYNIVGYNSYGNSLRGQDIIATRAFISISQQWNSYYSNIVHNEQFLSQEDKYASIRNIILNTGNPVLIYLYHVDVNRGAHSVLAYDFNYLTGVISIYDPNYPGQAKTIFYNSSNKTFNSYSGYDGIIYSGDGSLHLTEPYLNILNDADANFQGSGNATVKVTSHTNGQQVAERNINLSGNIQSGQVLVTKLKVFVGSTPFSVNVAADGTFSLPISLEKGINHLQFVTQGNDFVGRLIQLPNNMATVDFTINLNIPIAAILTTLTWDTNNTDVDLYVIDPAGDYSCFYHKITADGGELDYDITTGYGPEHWTLMATNTATSTVRYGQPYKIRLHYYDDQDNGPTNYTVSIKLYEGTGREQEYWYRGNLAVSNPDNDEPNDSGQDWVDIDDITLTQIQSASPFKSMQESNSNIKITVPVPSKEKRIKGGL